MWDAETGRELLACQYPGVFEVWVAAVSADGRSLALGGLGGGSVVLNTLDCTLSREDIGPWKLATYQAWREENGATPAP